MQALTKLEGKKRLREPKTPITVYTNENKLSKSHTLSPSQLHPHEETSVARAQG